MDRVETAQPPGGPGQVADFRVLGPVEVVRDGSPLPLGGPRQQALLALLLLEPGRTVSSDRLVDELWEGRPPRGADGTLRVYVSRLRAAVGSELRASRSGYVLDVDPRRCDAWHFERLARDAREALDRGAAGRAADRATAALALWRGPAFEGVGGTGLVSDEARRLEEKRLSAVEDWIDADLALGRHRSRVPDLESLVAQHPLRERFWHQLVTALHRSQRTAEAVAVCERAATVLADGLGVDVGDELRGALGRAVRQTPPPAPRAAADRHNLPAPLTSFVGRDEELAEVASLLRSHRLITLTGVGGAGKTRLALEAAREQVGVWRDGTWLVDLTSHVDPATTPEVVAAVTGARERSDVNALDGLLHRLRDREVLLVIDNCEHLARACGELVHAVLRTCPDVSVVATSRIALGVPGEVERRVGPLPTPDEHVPGVDAARSDSVRLFLERARERRADVAATPADLAAVAHVCRAVDGLPLAIELAAARTGSVSLSDMVALLGERLRLLRSSSPLAPPRHQTLRAAIDWSHDLLTPGERRLFAASSVFAGGFSRDAATTICADSRVGDTEQLLDRLVDCSLVVADVGAGTTRYRLLETIREYAAERLSTDPRRDELHRAHATYFLAVAQHARTEVASGKLEALAVLDLERDNLHAAMRWTLSTGSELAVPLAAVLWRHWLIRGERRQGLAWLEQALALPLPPSTPRALALAGAALLARLLGETGTAERFAHEGVALARSVGPPRALAVSLNVLTTLAAGAGDLESARRHCEASVAAARAADDERLEALALFVLTEGLLNAGAYEDVGVVGTRALELARSSRDDEVIALALARLGIAAVLDSRPDDGARLLGEALDHARSLGFPETAAWCCEGLAVVAAGRGEAVRAATLLGAGESLRQAGGGILQAAEAAARDAAWASVVAVLPVDRAESEVAAGRRMSLDEAASEAAVIATPRGRADTAGRL